MKTYIFAAIGIIAAIANLVILLTSSASFIGTAPEEQFANQKMWYWISVAIMVIAALISGRSKKSVKK